MFNQGGKIKWILVAAAMIVIAIAGAAIYFTIGQNNFPTGDFSGWKTYKNSEYGFELRYPAELAKKEKTANPGDGTEGGIGFTLYENTDPENDKKSEGMAFSADKFTLNPDKSATSTPLIKDECKIPSANDNVKLANKQISGANFTRIDAGMDGTAKGEMVTQYIGYVGKVNDICYKFIFLYAKDTNEGKQADINLFEKIISTITLNP